VAVLLDLFQFLDDGFDLVLVPAVLGSVSDRSATSCGKIWNREFITESDFSPLFSRITGFSSSNAVLKDQNS
jgi:hypothetical protein